MKLIQFKNSEGQNTYVSSSAIVRFVALAPHTTEIECCDGSKHQIQVNTLALIMRVFKDYDLDVIETAPDVDENEMITRSSSMNKQEKISGTVLDLTILPEDKKTRIKVKSV
jgi:hypothetical protein